MTRIVRSLVLRLSFDQSPTTRYQTTFLLLQALHSTFIEDMAGVSLRESQYYSHPRRKQPTAGSQGLSPRLPTPEASRSSYETYDSDSPGDAARRASTSYGQSDSWSDKTRSRRDSRNQYSPPYQTSDVQRPSLPPLKTVSWTRLQCWSEVTNESGTWRQLDEPTTYTKSV